MLLFPERAQERDIPAGDAVSVLTQDKSPVAILSGRGGAQALRERTEDVAMMARSQGREVMVIAADGRSGPVYVRKSASGRPCNAALADECRHRIAGAGDSYR
ncbi:conjugal transfer nickase/helicase TraI [Escherichia coli]|uniref:Conjugal transfer nickase/helicase TraI n=1 Tax=Escherichia coli TaxID=562 RepID=A0A376TVU1_ECOLX|nr:conjugal transfer nickase/helicase TraI [Escherichia coli]